MTELGHTSPVTLLERPRRVKKQNEQEITATALLGVPPFDQDKVYSSVRALGDLNKNKVNLDVSTLDNLYQSKDFDLWISANLLARNVDLGDGIGTQTPWFADKLVEAFKEKASKSTSPNPSRVIRHEDIDKPLIGLLRREGLFQLREPHDINHYISTARLYLSKEIADSLANIRDSVLEDDEEPLNLESVRWLLIFYFQRHMTEKPVICRTPDGLVESDAIFKDTEQITILFFPDGLVWLAILDPNESDSCETTVSRLVSGQSHLKLPDWV